MKEEELECAFPVHSKGWQSGMSLRDWFASQFLAGAASREAITSDDAAADLALKAYRVADCMLLARLEESNEL